jgi:hypothetical protein
MYFYFLSFCSFRLLICNFRVIFLWGYCAVSKLSSDVLSGGGRCLFGSTRHFRTVNCTPLLLISRISRHLTNLPGRSLLRRAFFRVRPQFICGHPRGRGLSIQLVNIFLGARVNGIFLGFFSFLLFS